MVDIAFYVVSESIARRSGVIEQRYRTKDGRFILDNKDLSRIRFTAQEYTQGLSGVVMVTKQEAYALIRQNNYAMGLPNVVQGPTVEEPTEPTAEEEQVVEEPSEQPSEETQEEAQEETSEEEESE